MKYKILLGGVVVISIAGASLVLFGNSTHETTPVEDEVVELTALEKLTKEIKDSEEFQNETNLRAEARAMYQLSVAKQDEALTLSEKALESYQAATTLENDWKNNQRVINN